ncbi:MAG: transposase, partial [Alphaproteobacteria bacterium]|nr:transposase [Alphaproteobacteria bacterium]
QQPDQQRLRGIDDRHGRGCGRVEWETLEWVNWYNNERLHSAIGYVTPQEPEEAFYANMNDLDKVA